MAKYPFRIPHCYYLALLTSSLSASIAFAVDNDKAPIRKEKITTIVIHAIGGPICRHDKVVFTEAPGDTQRWKNWFEQQTTVSIHYIIDRNGQVAQSINEDRIAWHALDYNKRSIGIELINKGDGIERYPAQQVAALTTLVKSIMAKHKGITKHNIVRHSDIDNRKFYCGGQMVNFKQDPGEKFPYQAFLAGL